MIFCLFGLSLLAMALPSSASPAGEQAHPILHLVDYIGADYPGAVSGGKVINPDEYAEQQEFAETIHSLLGKLPAQAARDELLATAVELKDAIEQKQGAARIAQLTQVLRSTLISAYEVQVAPRSPPDLSLAPGLYTESCAGCHGAQGRGDGPLAMGLKPPPPDFRDPAWHSARSAYGLFNTITQGLQGTAMTAWGQLPEAQRWALAFYIANLAVTEDERAQGEALWKNGTRQPQLADLAKLSLATPDDLRAEAGTEAVALLSYLRGKPELLGAQEEAPLAKARRLLGESLTSLREDNPAEAERLALSAYLDGFELAESALSVADAALMRQIEKAMMAYRNTVKTGDTGTAGSQVQTLDTLLAQAASVLGSTALTPGMSFTSAFIILLREGLEAILVLAVIFAFLKKSGRSDALPYVHFGWIAALALGGVTWFVASRLITVSGASRELTEGLAALAAAVVLLYVGYWLHNQSHSLRWQQYVHKQISGVLGGGRLWGLALLSFLAVYREAFETVLFYQTLWVQAGPGGHSALLAGIGVAALALVAIGWAILRLSVHLPLKLFFSVNSVLIFVLAVIFTGQGIAALQEAGKLPVSPVDHLPTIGLIGFHPNLQTILAQSALIVAACVWLAWERHKDRQQIMPSQV
jgi:high-affinity iron transporter